MKKFVYNVASYEFSDVEAFGAAWKEAKAKAIELHTPIYRSVIKNEDVQQEVYTKAGCFLPISLVMIKNIMIF